MAATYYVKTAGNDGNTGLSDAQAWKTLQPVNAHAFVPGDVVLFNGGQTFTGGIYTHDIASTQASPVTFSSYGTGKATISTAAGNNGCFLYKMGGIVISNLNFTGPGAAAATHAGILIWNDSAGDVVYPYVRITGCAIVGYKDGIAIGGGAGRSGYSDVRIESCDSHDNSRNGIITWGVWGSNYALANVYVGNCVAYGNTGIAGASEPTGSGIQLSSINGGTMEFCTAYGNGATNNFASGPIGLWCWDCNAVTIQKCESYNNLSGGGDGGGFDIDGGCTNCIIQYCYAHGNKGGGIGVFQFAGAGTFSGNIVRYNISENDIGGGIAFWSSDSANFINSTQVYNNTVFSSVAPTCRVLPGTALSGNTVTNNIFLTTGGMTLVDYQNTVGLAFSKNNYFNISGAFIIWWGGTSYASVAAWGQDAGGLSVNPGLANAGAGGTIYPAALTTLSAYKLTSASSPMVNAGAAVTSPGSTDFYGDTLYSGDPDIGADEYVLPPPSSVVFAPMASFIIR